MANIKNKTTNKRSYLCSWNLDTDTNARPWTMLLEAKDFNSALRAFMRAATFKNDDPKYGSIVDVRVTELRSDTLAKYRNDSKTLKALMKTLANV